jgi:alpha-D-ribose 1-methylphosphonate 5-triphosphate synthase subunit PhnI
MYPRLSLAQIKQQMQLAVNRVMAEGSLYDPDLAALAIKQSWGDLVEAAFLLAGLSHHPASSVLQRTPRYQPHVYCSAASPPSLKTPLEAKGWALPSTMCIVFWTLSWRRKITSFTAPVAAVEASRSRSYPQSSGATGAGGIGGTRDGGGDGDGRGANFSSLPSSSPPHPLTPSPPHPLPPFDLTRQSLTTPTRRDARLQNLARADEGFLLSMAYSTQRGYGKNHPFAGEVRMGQVEVVICPEELGFEVAIAQITITEVQMVNQFKGSKEIPPQFTQGYGLTFGYNERKAMAMALVDRALQARVLGESIEGPAQDEEFVLYHSDNIEAQGFVQHLKLPHYIDFQAELNLVRKLRQEYEQAQMKPPQTDSDTSAAAPTPVPTHERISDEVQP